MWRRVQVGEMKPLSECSRRISKSPLVDLGEDIEERKEQVGENHIANQKTKEWPVKNDIGIDVERLRDERRYPTRESRPL